MGLPRLNLPPLDTRDDGTIAPGLLSHFVRTLRDWVRYVNTAITSTADHLTTLDADRPQSGTNADTATAGPTAGTTAFTAKSVTVPATGVPGLISVWASLGYTKSVGTDRFSVDLEVATVMFAESIGSDATATIDTQPVFGSLATDGSTSTVIDLVITRVAGTGTATMQTLARRSPLTWIFVAT